MKSALEFADARLSGVELAPGMARLRFSHAYIHKSKGAPGKDAGSLYSQEAELSLLEAQFSPPLPPLPNTVADGHLEIGGIKLGLLPLPFRRRGAALLALCFVDGSTMRLAGSNPAIELLGQPIFIDNIA